MISSSITASFLFLLLLLQGGHQATRAQDYHITPAEAVALPYDQTRLAPWAADYFSRVRGTAVTDDMVAPTPADYTSVAQNAFSEPAVEDLQKENTDLRKRLELLEQMMKDKLSEPPISGTQSEEAKTDKKSVPGWRVEYHSWNKDGKLGKDALYTALLENCGFTGGLGLSSKSEMIIYRFMGTLRVREPGRYVFAFDMTCIFDHACRMDLTVDGEPVINFAGKTEGTRIANGLPLTAGDHAVEFVTSLQKNLFLNYQPWDKFKWHPLIKAPSDLNPREFAADELFSVIPRKSRIGLRSCS